MLEKEPISQEKNPAEIALEKILANEAETICFPAAEGLEAVDLTECTLEPLKDHSDVYAIVSHKQTGAVGYTRKKDLFDSVRPGEMLSSDFYE